MSRSTKQRKQFALNLLLYGNPVHPELFRRYRSQDVERRTYRAAVHLIDGGHLVEFDAPGSHLTNGGENHPQNGLIEEVPCRGERLHEVETHDNVRYMISTQEEQLQGSLFDATRAEILDYAQKRELMWTEVAANEAEGRGRFLGVLDVECRAGELLVQSFHVYDEFQMVVKTQGLIEVIKPSRK